VVDLGRYALVSYVVVTNRVDCCTARIGEQTPAHSLDVVLSLVLCTALNYIYGLCTCLVSARRETQCTMWVSCAQMRAFIALSSKWLGVANVASHTRPVLSTHKHHHLPITRMRSNERHPRTAPNRCAVNYSIGLFAGPGYAPVAPFMTFLTDAPVYTFNFSPCTSVRSLDTTVGLMGQNIGYARYVRIWNDGPSTLNVSPHTQVHRHTRGHTNRQTHRQTNRQTHTHTHTHTRARAHTHTHTHLRSCACHKCR
jgi:hypothetical protein